MDGRYNNGEALRMVKKESDALTMNVTGKQEGFFLSNRNNLSHCNKRVIMDYAFMQTR
jgi:hypothetical protein